METNIGWDPPLDFSDPEIRCKTQTSAENIMSIVLLHSFRYKDAVWLACRLVELNNTQIG
jgi:hypothetical protein